MGICTHGKEVVGDEVELALAVANPGAASVLEHELEEADEEVEEEEEEDAGELVVLELQHEQTRLLVGPAIGRVGQLVFANVTMRHCPSQPWVDNRSKVVSSRL